MTESLGLLVLIVDDNEQNVKLARDVLRAAGFRTLEVANGADAVASASRDLPDVILIDIRLPDMDGTEVARRIRDDPRTARIPLVAVTSLAPPEGDRWFGEMGFDGYLEKPLRIREFPDEVRRFAPRSGDA